MKIFIATAAALAIIGGSALIARSIGNTPQGDGANVSVINGTQIIDITAKGGYFPRATVAKANMPTILKINTNGTFDCSAAITIPKLDYRATLPSAGITEVPIPPQKPGSKLQGLCAMGMYNFSVTFN